MDYKNKELKTYYSNLRLNMLPIIPVSEKVLEIGCGNGVLLDYLKKNNLAKETWGVEMNHKEYLPSLDHFLLGKAEDNLVNLPNNYFDCIICNDVLEHVFDPYALLKELKLKLRDGGVVVASIPNVRHLSVIINLVVNGDFRYRDAGIMDFTHMRFFTKKSIIRMFKEAGYEIDILKPVSRGLGKDRWIEKLVLFFSKLFLGSEIDVVQFAVVTKK